LCRQGREAVQVTYALDVLSVTPLVDEVAETSPESYTSHIQGRIHLRLANVGRHSPTPATVITVFNRKQRKFMISPDDQSGSFGFAGGALSSAFLPDTGPVQGALVNADVNSSCRLVRARPLTEVSPELREMLRIAQTERQATEVASDKLTSNSSRQRKLSRLYTALQAVNRNFFVNDLVGYTTLSGVKVCGTDKALELRTICNYREQKKREQIERMLSRAQTVEHCLETSFGCTEFFEYKLTNPHNQEDTVRIDIEDSENNTVVITDPRETKTFKAALGITTPTEDDLFTADLSASQNTGPQDERKSRLVIFLRPKESVLIPINYLKKLIRLPPLVLRNVHPSCAGASDFANPCQLTHANVSNRVWTRVSDPGILTESGSINLGQPTDLLVKVGLGNCPEVREFLIAVYLDPFQIRPAYVWQWTVHALHRIDLAATLGQISPPTGVLLRTEGILPAGSSRRVAIYTSRPQEVILGTECEAGMNSVVDQVAGLSFLLSPGAVYELKVSQFELSCPQTSQKC
uniref:Anillin domain-containing protein n=1 Tax=Echinostoma caproni TaxID=27848 RepID=A0A183B186_9TREM